MKTFLRLLVVAACCFALYITTPPECRRDNPPRYCID